MKLNRRDLLKLSVGASALTLASCSDNTPAPDGWNQGAVKHILPMASHRSFNIKLSLSSALNTPPTLMVGDQAVLGLQQDTQGQFWAFRVTSLSPSTQYDLRLVTAQSQALCDSWPLKTLPALEDDISKLTMVCYTCAGGPDLPVLPGNLDAFKPLPYRHQSFKLMLEKKPDFVIANGDHIYWDYRSWANNLDNPLAKMAMKCFLASYGSFNEAIGVKGTANEATLKAVANEQIADSYGVQFRSTPVYFITDDHDYFDNDDATPELVTFPPDRFHRQLRNLLQDLYFPEFIVEDELPLDVPGLMEENSVKLSRAFGEIRYGTLFSGLLFDCGGHLDLNGEQARLFPEAVEDWVISKTVHEDSRHLIHFPSHPMGWTAGKWREWYPDLLASTGTLITAIESDENGGKYLWQQGWRNQHQRLLAALHKQTRRKPIIISGDLHLLGAGLITKSDDLDFELNPVLSVLSGPVGIGGLGWLSRARGLAAKTPEGLEVTETIPPQELNGFTVVNITGDNCAIDLFACPQGYVSPEDIVLTKQSFV